MKTARFFAFLMMFLVFAAHLSAEEQRFRVPVGDSPQKGPKDAPVTIIEFVDFQ